MTAPAIAEYLKFANVQMAAESLFGFKTVPNSQNLTPGAQSNAPLTTNVLTDGNLHASKFTATQAAEFLATWEVVEHKPNATTGFSGTLMRAIKDDPATGTKAGEYVISFRTTEFLDDAARDNQATNTLEIKEKGWAFGQIDDMEAWHKHLTSTKLIPDSAKFSVTGYSLGGHLATAFNLLRREDGTQSRIDKVVTFNGAGVGTIQKDRGTLGSVMAYFHGLRIDSTKIEAAIADDALRAVVGTPPPAAAASYNLQTDAGWNTYLNSKAWQGTQNLLIQNAAIAHDVGVLDELVLRSLSATGGSGDDTIEGDNDTPVSNFRLYGGAGNDRIHATTTASLESEAVPVPNTAIAQESLDYQMAYCYSFASCSRKQNLRYSPKKHVRSNAHRHIFTGACAGGACA